MLCSTAAIEASSPTHMHIDMCVYMSIGMCIGIRMDMRMDMRRSSDAIEEPAPTRMRMGIRTGISTNMCIDMRTDMHTYAWIDVCRQVRGLVQRHVSLDISLGMCYACKRGARAVDVAVAVKVCAATQQGRDGDAPLCALRYMADDGELARDTFPDLPIGELAMSGYGGVCGRAGGRAVRARCVCKCVGGRVRLSSTIPSLESGLVRSTGFEGISSTLSSSLPQAATGAPFCDISCGVSSVNAEAHTCS